MTCEKCADKNDCPLYRGEDEICWYKKIREEKEKRAN